MGEEQTASDAETSDTQRRLRSPIASSAQRRCVRDHHHDPGARDRRPENLSEQSLYEALDDLRPTLVAWVISFLLTGMFWVANRDLFARVRVVNRDLVWLNLLFLLPVSLIPFAASVLGKYPDEPVAVHLYGIVLIAATLMRFVLYWYVVKRPALLWPDVSTDRAGLDSRSPRRRSPSTSWRSPWPTYRQRSVRCSTSRSPCCTSSSSPCCASTRAPDPKPTTSPEFSELEGGSPGQPPQDEWVLASHEDAAEFVGDEDEGGEGKAQRELPRFEGSGSEEGVERWDVGDQGE